MTKERLLDTLRKKEGEVYMKCLGEECEKRNQDIDKD